MCKFIGASTWYFSQKNTLALVALKIRDYCWLHNIKKNIFYAHTFRFHGCSYHPYLMIGWIWIVLSGEQLLNLQSSDLKLVLQMHSLILIYQIPLEEFVLHVNKYAWISTTITTWVPLRVRSYTVVYFFGWRQVKAPVAHHQHIYTNYDKIYVWTDLSGVGTSKRCPGFYET